MNIDKMKHLIFLVKTESTGNPKELAQKNITLMPFKCIKNVYS
jgi:hypothetical protein